MREGEPVLMVHHRGGRGLDHAMPLLTAAIEIADAAPPIGPLVVERHQAGGSMTVAVDADAPHLPPPRAPYDARDLTVIGGAAVAAPAVALVAQSAGCRGCSRSSG